MRKTWTWRSNADEAAREQGTWLDGSAGTDAIIDGDGGNNTLVGTEGDDLLRGFAGNDFLEGLGGNDTLDGGSGFDQASYAAAGAGVNVSLAIGGPQNTGGAGTDTLIGIEFLTGSGHDDTLTGSTGNGVFELFQGNAGNDTINGGINTDLNNFTDGNQLAYFSSPDGVSVNLATGNALDGFGGTDSIANFFFVSGSEHNDTIVGRSGSEFEMFDGRGGNDTINGGTGSGTNRVIYQSAASAVTVDFALGTATGGGGNDTLININGVRGSNSGDTLNGSNTTLRTEEFDGRAGNDTIDGRGGFDLVRYDLGPTSTGIVAQLNGAADGTITDGQGGTDTVRNVESVRGTGFNDSMAGSAALNYEAFEGLAGNDTINGGAITDRHFYDNQNEAGYWRAPNAVSVNLATGVASDGHGTVDSLSNINVVGGSASHDTITGSSSEVFERFIGGAGNDTIHGGAIANKVAWDGNGLDYDLSPGAVNVDLIAGTAVDGYAGGSTDTFTNITWVRGSDFNDTIRGSHDGVFIEQFRPGLGNDTIDGRGGLDLLSYQDLTGPVTINFATGTVTGAGTDTFTGIEWVRATDANDTLIGSSNPASIGVSGDPEIFEGLGGNDSINGGGGGLDFVAYSRSRAAVTVTLTGGGNGTASDGLGGTDTLAGIEGAFGSIFNDRLNGSNDAGRELFEGGRGNDTIDGNGGVRDMALYSRSDTGVTVNLTAGSASNDGFGNTDTLLDIEDVWGSFFNDTITGNALANELDGGDGNGNDVIDGGAGNDTLRGVGGNDTLNGGAGNDRIDGGTGTDTVSYANATAAVAVNLALTTAQATGGSGSDTILNVERVVGSAFNDTLTGNAAVNVLSGGLGNDSYTVGAGDVVSEALNAGIDLVSTALTSYTLGANVDNGRILSAAAANMTGNALNNVIHAGAGNNVIDGGSGLDTVSYAFATAAVKVNLALATAQATGGSASDTLVSIERVTGSAYHDTLTGNAGANVLSGGNGNDTLNGAAGADTMAGGLGNDLYYVDNAGDVVSEAVGAGTDTAYAYVSHTLATNVENGRILTAAAANMTGNALDNLIYAGAGNNVINGGTGLDTVSYAFASAAVSVNLALTTAQATGGSGSDTLANIERATGGSFNDVLTGSSAANVLNGGAGNDVLNGGLGNDVLIGGLGLDTFRFTSALNATSNVDAVSGFVAADDRFLLSSAVFTQAGPAGALAASRFRIGSNAADADDRIVYEQTSGKLFYDADGTGATAKVLFATLAPNTALSAGDFFIG